MYSSAAQVLPTIVNEHFFSFLYYIHFKFIINKADLVKNENYQVVFVHQIVRNVICVKSYSFFVWEWTNEKWNIFAIKFKMLTIYCDLTSSSISWNITIAQISCFKWDFNSIEEFDNLNVYSRRRKRRTDLKIVIWKLIQYQFWISIFKNLS